MLRCKRRDFLAIVFVELDGETNCLEVDAERLVGLIAEIHLDGEDAAVERGFLGEFFFVLRGNGPGERGDGEALMRFEGGGFEGVLLSLRRGRLIQRGVSHGSAWRCAERCSGGDDGDGAGREVREDLVSHRVIINLSHIVA